MNKKCIAIMIGLTTILGLTGCMDKNLYNEVQYKDDAEEIVTEYLESKYNIKVKITNLECEYKEYTGLPSVSEPSGVVIADLEDKQGNSIKAMVDLRNEESIKVYDNYQEKEIEKAIEDKLDTIVENKDKKIKFGINKGSMLTDMYFNGDNIADVLSNKEQFNMFIVGASQQDLSKITKEELNKAFGDNINMYVLNYKQDSYLKDSIIETTECYAPFLIDYIHLTDSGLYEHIIYDVYEVSDFKYSYGGTYITVEAKDEANINFRDYDKDSVTDAENIKVYSIDTDSEYMEFWFKDIKDNTKIFLKYKDDKNTHEYKIDKIRAFTVVEGLSYTRWYIGNRHDMELAIIDY